MAKKNYISVNVKKIKAATKVNSLLSENYRNDKDAKRYDNGHRVIDTNKTINNVYLLDRPNDYDRLRKDRIDNINTARAKRRDPKLMVKQNVKQLQANGTLQAAKSAEAAQMRRLRSDTVDTLGLVVQPSHDFIMALPRNRQIEFFRDALQHLQEHPDWYGRIDTAVIHFDEQTPHMQCLATALNQETLTSDAKKIVGNKTKMSDRQTMLSDAMQSKGWRVQRGIKRVNNPEYRNFADDMKAAGLQINRHNDAILQQKWQKIKAEGKKVAELQKNSAAIINAAEESQKAAEQSQQAARAAWNEVNQARDAVVADRAVLDKRETALKAREQSLLKRETALNDRDAVLTIKAENLLKTQNTAFQAIDTLNRLLERAQTPLKRKQLNDQVRHIKPVQAEQPDNLPDLASSLKELDKSIDSGLVM